MNPKTALKWLEADQYCKTHHVPSVLAKVASDKARVAMRKAIPAKPVIRLPGGQKKETLPRLKKELDRVFSIVIRTARIDGNGYTRCVTCGRVDQWKRMDAGHYVPRQDLATRWAVENVWPQCKPCNGFRGGEPEKMAEWIDKVYGIGAAAKLRETAKSHFKLSRHWLTERIEFFKSMISKDAP